MAREFSRPQRLADQIQRELAALIQFEVKDPRLGMVTLNEARVSKDLGYADIYFTNLLSSEPVSQADQRQAEQILNAAAPFLRKALASRIRIRSVPQLRFHFDVSLERGRNLSDLIDRAVGDADNRDDPNRSD